ncbi:MAG TPA: hypothetical protein VK590_13540 [Saprospiraceae bacterium]|nr:hypothetical protein [Saprospiraceae bacterium]
MRIVLILWISLSFLSGLSAQKKSTKSVQKKDLHMTHRVGESYGGGIVFYTYDNGEHGLIAAKEDQAKDIKWYNGVIKLVGVKGDGLGAGMVNTMIAHASQMHDNPDSSFAARVCINYSVTKNGVTYGGWYLPSKYELNLLYKAKKIVGFTFDTHHSSYYWSSTETASNTAVAQEFIFGNILSDAGKGDWFCVRAIRSF